MAYADFKSPFILHTDASSDGLGAVLYQNQDNQRRVIAYASRSLSPSERNYPAHKLEFLALKWAITHKLHECLYGAEFQVFTDNPLMYILTTAKLDATGHRWVAALSNYTFSISYKPGRNNTDADPLSRIKWPEAVDISSQSVHAVCEGVQAPHGKIESLCHGAQAVGVLSQDNMPPGMTSLQCSQAQLNDPAICQIIQAIQNKTLDRLKIKQDMHSDLKAFLRVRKHFKLKQGILYRKNQINNDRARLQLVLLTSHRQKTMAGCLDQISHLGQDRVLELLRDRFFWPGMHMDVTSYINSCPRCIRRKTQSDVAPLHNIEATQPLELIHLDYLQIKPSKGNIENVLIVTDHFTRYTQVYPSKTQTALATAVLLWNNFIVHYGFPTKIISDQGHNFESELIANLCQVAGVKKLRTSPYHPQTNG